MTTKDGVNVVQETGADSSVRSPLYSVNEFTTPRNSFADDVEQVLRTGGDGIGIWESKLCPLEDDEASIKLLSDAGLRASLCVPSSWSLFSSHLSPTPESPEDRAEAIATSIGRLAAFEPACVVVTPGSAVGYEDQEAMEIVKRSMSRILEAAADHGVTIGLEAIRASSRGFIHSLEGSLELRAAMADPNLKLIWDVWHGWDEPDIHTLLTENVDALVGVQVNDWREPTRVWTDRLLPGDGVADVVGLIRTIASAGYEGWYDLEVFSDDGTYVERLPDSLWLLPHEQMLQMARDRFLAVWDQATSQP
jgi:sugar phosphate isomerase/epimerase